MLATEAQSPPSAAAQSLGSLSNFLPDPIRRSDTSDTSDRGFLGHPPPPPRTSHARHAQSRKQHAKRAVMEEPEAGNPLLVPVAGAGLEDLSAVESPQLDGI